MDGVVACDVLRIPVADEVLQSERSGERILEFLKQTATSQILEDRSCRIEVPVVVVPEGIRRMRTALRAGGGHRRGFIERRVIDSRSRLQEVAQTGRSFRLGERRLLVVGAQLFERPVEINSPALDVSAVECAQQTLADGMTPERQRRLPPLIDDDSVLDDHHRRRVQRVAEVVRLTKFVDRPTEVVGRVCLPPVPAGNLSRTRRPARSNCKRRCQQSQTDSGSRLTTPDHTPRSERTRRRKSSDRSSPCCDRRARRSRDTR